MANIEQNRKLMVEQMRNVKAQLSEGSGKSLGSNFIKLQSDWNAEIDKIQKEAPAGIFNKRVWSLSKLGQMDRKKLLKLVKI
jgi:hypothetical protein